MPLRYFVDLTLAQRQATGDKESEQQATAVLPSPVGRVIEYPPNCRSRRWPVELLRSRRHDHAAVLCAFDIQSAPGTRQLQPGRAFPRRRRQVS